MTQVIEVPGMGEVEFPDDMSDDDIAAAIKRSTATEKPKSPGIGDFVKNAYGAQIEPSLSIGSGMFAEPVAGFAGIGQGLKNLVSPGMPAADRVEQVRSALTYQPRTDAGRAIVEGAAKPLEFLERATDKAGEVAGRPGAGISGMAGNYGLDPIRKDEGSPLGATIVKTAANAVPTLLTRGRSGGMARDVPPRSGSPRMGVAAGEKPAASVASASAKRSAGLESIPSKDELKRAAAAAYKQAEESGVVVTPESFGGLKQRIISEMQKDGIDSTLHPDSSAALKRIAEKDGALTLQELETLRRIANDAGGSIKSADRRLAGKMVDEIDDYIDSLGERDIVAGDATKAKALKEARDLYARRMKAEELDRLMERAELSAANFSGSGMENAIRTEFRNLAKNERRMRRFTKEQQEAIKLVAKGGPLENVLRMLGKLAPTGVVSGALSSGAGFLTGGPAGAIALPAAGAAARYAATRMTMGNAARANELMRRGPLPPQLPGGLITELPPEIGALGR